MNAKASYLPLIVQPNDDGYLATCPGLQGAFAEGDTIEEAMFNCIDVVKMILAYRMERGEAPIWQEVEITPQTQLSFSIPIAVAA
ncbi:MAG: hypothetical protein KF832_31665 [Caldilineaceae bacterium]|nr:hypothetical protein [Caldilineaceae bacterium]